jgi:hypothetical protein
MDLYEAHKDHRDRFEILAFHDGTVKSFAELDKKIQRPREMYWRGRDLPFPILLDATGQTIKDYGVRAFPTTLLIDPEGRLVGEAGEEELEKKLPPLPAPVRVARALDRGVAFSLNDETLAGAVKVLSRVGHIDIGLDEPALKAAGVAPDTRVPLKLAGLVSLRSALDLVLSPLRLACRPGDKGLVVTAAKAGGPPAPLSEAQKVCARRIEEVLNKRVSFAFKGRPLAEVAEFFEGLTQENFVLDPAGRRAGRIDPKAMVTGAGKEVPLREGLTRLLEPLGLTFVVRDEVVVLTAKSDRK